MTFEDFGFKSDIMEGIREAGFKIPSPIQAKAIPLILEGKDVIAQSHTGTGKTAAFGLPVMNNMLRNVGIELIVISPTRELASQISDELYRLGRFAGIRTCSILGGHSYSRQLKLLENGTQVLAATPGRLLDMLKSGKIEIIEPITVVLDEADEMLDMGFYDDIMAIFDFMPQKRQTLLFSATMPEEIKKLAESILKDPVSIKAETVEESTNTDIEQSYYIVEEEEKKPALTRLIEEQDPEKAIVFCRTKLEVDELSTFLVARGFNAKALHGDLDQSQRNQVMSSFRKGMIDILVATDVAARGLDIADVSHVFNYHIPFNAKSYIHRVGRTGRAGNKGIAITLVTPSEFRNIRRIEKNVGSSIEVKVIPTLHDIRSERIKRLAAEALEYTPNKAGIEFVEGLEHELDPRSIAMILASMLLEEEESETEEPDQIGFTEKRIRQLLKKEDDKFSKTHRGFGKTNRRHEGEEKHKSRKSNDFHRKDRKDHKDRKDKKRGGYGEDFKNRDKKFQEEKPKRKNRNNDSNR
ncbi:DEAD/DEAH box helicase [bacterium]|nr:DEAD/DEAH box helicase [bacterium]